MQAVVNSDAWPSVCRLVVYCGIPGSGKSTDAQRFPADAVLSADGLRVSAAPAGPAYWRAMFTRAQQRLSGGDGVVIDACNTRADLRWLWLSLGVPAELVVMDTPTAVCKLVQAERAHPVPAAVIDRYARELRRALRYEIPREPWDGVRVVAR